MEGKKLPVYGDGKNIREWIHVSDHVRLLQHLTHLNIPPPIAARVVCLLCLLFVVHRFSLQTQTAKNLTASHIAHRLHLLTPALRSSIRNTASATMRSSGVSLPSHSRSCQYDAFRTSDANGCPIMDHAHRGMLAPSQLLPVYSYNSTRTPPGNVMREMCVVINANRSPSKHTGKSSAIAAS